MVDWWSENGPPAYIAVAAYLGLIKTKKTKKPSTNLNELLGMAGTGGMIN